MLKGIELLYFCFLNILKLFPTQKHILALNEWVCLQLRLGAAEEQFLAMTGGGADGCDDDNDNDDDKDDDDNGNKVPDCLQVVSSILSELDTDILRSRVLQHVSGYWPQILELSFYIFLNVKTYQ